MVILNGQRLIDDLVPWMFRFNYEYMATFGKGKEHELRVTVKRPYFKAGYYTYGIFVDGRRIRTLKYNFFTSQLISS